MLFELSLTLFIYCDSNHKPIAKSQHDHTRNVNVISAKKSCDRRVASEISFSSKVVPFSFFFI